MSCSAAGAYSRTGEHRARRYTPAVTIVAAWISADTGVGPSIASGNQVCSPNCADLPTAARKRKQQKHVRPCTSNPHKTRVASCSAGAHAKSPTNCVVPASCTPVKILNARPKSPTRFISIALIADLFACKRVNQKLIKRYDARPTPSQPRKSTKKLSPVISISIQKVKKDK